MLSFIVVAVVVSFVVAVAAAVLISTGRAASLDDSAVMARVLDRRTSAPRGRRHVM